MSNQEHYQCKEVPRVAESDELVRVRNQDGVTRLTIDSPSNRNALGGIALAQLVSAVKTAQADPRIRAIVLTGSGTVFSSGADLRDKTELSVIEQAYRDLFGSIRDGCKPVIARVNGHCFGGAIGLVAVCDFAVADEAATFAFTEVRLGRTATLASVVSLPRLRPVDAANLLLRGNRIDAKRAAAIGLVSNAVPSDRLDAEVGEIVGDILAGAPIAIANTKRLIREVPYISHDAAFDLAFQITRETSGSPEANEGTAAFREKRAPIWPVPQ